MKIKKALKVGLDIFGPEKMVHLMSIGLTKASVDKLHAAEAILKTAGKAMKVFRR